MPRLPESSAPPPGLSRIRRGSAIRLSRTAPRPASRARTGAAGPAVSARSCRTRTSQARDQEWMRSMPSLMSDRTSPNSNHPYPPAVKEQAGSWLFRHRTALPLPIAAAILLIPAGHGEFGAEWAAAGVAITIFGEAIRLWGVQHIRAIL